MSTSCALLKLLVAKLVCPFICNALKYIADGSQCDYMRLVSNSWNEATSTRLLDQLLYSTPNRLSQFKNDIPILASKLRDAWEQQQKRVCTLGRC